MTLDVLGIPPHLWTDAIKDSRMLDFDSWASVYLPQRPVRIPQHVWEFTARKVYEDGPLTYYIATHVN